MSSPPALRGKSLLFLFMVPLAAAEALIYTRASSWSLPAPSTRLWIGVVVLVVCPLVYWLTRGKKWSLSLLALLSAIWVLVSALWAYRTQNPTLAFFVVGLAAIALAFLAMVRLELERPFLDGGVRWFQGLPTPMAGIEAHLIWGEQPEREIRVGRIDEDGAFVFARSPLVDAGGLKAASLRLRLKTGEYLVETPVRLVSVSPDYRCVGVAFAGLAVEDRVRLGELIGYLRGMGYAKE